MADGDLAVADPASNCGGSQVWLFANSMCRLNRIVEELHLPSRSAVMLARPPAIIARRRSGRPLHFLPTAIGPALIRFRDMAVRKYMASRKFMYRPNMDLPSSAAAMLARRSAVIAGRRSDHPLPDGRRRVGRS